MCGLAAASVVGVMDDPGEVRVSLFASAADPREDRERLARAAAAAGGVDAGAVAIVQRCPRCGGPHGKPIVTVHGAAHPELHVSLGRAGGTTAIAVTLAGPVGIDIETLARVGRAGFDDVAFDEHERGRIRAASEPDRMRAAGWTAKEAVLKATGDGLNIDPRALRIDSKALRLEAWADAPVPLGDILLRALRLGPGLVGTLAVLSPAPVHVVRGD
jgi:4'-phosphopantetheinyl transferase